MKDPARMGRIGLKAFFIFLLTTAFAITFGLVIGTVIQPGIGFEIAGATAPPVRENPASLPEG